MRRVASFLKSSARSRCLPRTFDGKFSIWTVAVQKLGSGPGADPRDAGVAVGGIAHEREQVRNELWADAELFAYRQPHRE